MIILRFDAIRYWAENRNLLAGSTPQKQMTKLLEEIQELQDAIEADNFEEFIDAIGDCVVVLTIMAAQWGLDIEDCIEAAYQEIKDRKGKMVDGVFVKEK